jgi:branched-chain amino acid transport system permease protein
MLVSQIIIDGFAISALYGLGAVGFTLMFGVSGVLNLAHGSTMLVAAVVAWLVADSVGSLWGALAGVLAGVAAAFGTYFCVVRPIQRSRAISREETEIFVLTGTLLWGIMLQEAVAYFTTTSPHTVRPLIAGVTDIAGVRTPTNEILTAVLCWAAIGGLWLLVNRTRAGKALLAASINPRGLTLLGYELSRIYLLVWAIYGVLAGIAGVLLGAFLGVSSDNAGTLTASAFSIVVLGGLGSVSGSLLPPTALAIWKH